MFIPRVPIENKSALVKCIIWALNKQLAIICTKHNI